MPHAPGVRLTTHRALRVTVPLGSGWCAGFPEGRDVFVPVAYRVMGAVAGLNKLCFADDGSLLGDDVSAAELLPGRA
jgi:hypothetical protein